MRTLNGTLATHLTQECTTLAWCWKVTRADASVYGFTTHDKDITLSGTTYKAETGLSATAAQARAGASVDNLDISGYIGSTDITEDDLMAGLWDGASIEVRLVNWADTSQNVVMQAGTIGQIKLVDGTFIAEMRSLSQALQQTVGRSMTRRCDAELGDTRCGVSMASFTATGTVTGVTDRQVFAATDLPISNGGLLTWTAGENDGRQMEVKIASAGTITLALPMAYDIQVGDTYSVQAGCDKNLSTCAAVYSNATRFRGFPAIPGPDVLYQYPDAK